MGYADDAGDRRDVTDKIVVEFLEQRGVDRGSRPDHEERVAVCWCAHDRLNTNIGAATRPVLDDEWLAEPLREPTTYQARGDVVHGTGSKRDDEAYRLRRIGLRSRNPRQDWQRGSARCQMQKLSAGKFYGAPPLSITTWTAIPP